MVAASGLSGSKEVAQIEVSVGMGLLAGSTIMVLTVVWGSCIVAGKCDLVGSTAKDTQDTRGLSLTGNVYLIKYVGLPFFFFLYIYKYSYVSKSRNLCGPH